MTSRLTLLTILLFTFNFQQVHAQDLDTVTISGRVMDQNTAVLPGAEVQAKLIKTGLTRTTTADAEGRYRITMSAGVVMPRAPSSCQIAIRRRMVLHRSSRWIRRSWTVSLDFGDGAADWSGNMLILE